MTSRGRHLSVQRGYGAEQVLRLEAFRAAHPGVLVEPIRGELVWQARIPEVNGETIITRHELRDLLDKLGEVLGEPGTGRG